MGQGPSGSRPVRAGRYAAIDIGTVTCRMLVADIDGQGRLRELDREYEITNARSPGHGACRRSRWALPARP